MIITGKQQPYAEKPNSISFNYNTTIVDLNPFKKESIDFNPDISNSSRSSSGTDFNTQNALKLQKTRKYLINKNIRFYEPIKDAEIIAQMHLLRSKLHSDKNIEYTSIGKSKTFSQIVQDRSKTPQTLAKKQILLKDIQDNSSVKSQTSLNDKKLYIIKSGSDPSLSKQEFTKLDNLNTEVKILNDDLNEDESEFPGLKKFSLKYRKKKLIENQTNTLDNNNKMPRTKTYNSANALQSKSSLPIISQNSSSNLKSNNFNFVIRKSRKFRLNNIYRPVDHVHLESGETLQAYHSSDECVHKPSSANSNSNQKEAKKSAKQEENELFYCQDPCCEFKSIINNNLNYIQSKKEFPNERYQRVKNNEVRIVQNIISDIPNTLTTMSSIGKVTNIEKILANKLSEFYTEKTRYIK